MQNGKDKMLLGQAQKAGVMLNEEQQDFLANRLEENDDATANAIFMASLSSAGSLNDDTVTPTYDSNTLSKGLHNEVKEMKDIFKQMEDDVDQCSMEKKCLGIEKKQLLINNDRLFEENISCDIMCTYLRSLNEVDDYGKCKSSLKIESKPINAYFKNNKVVHRDYLKVTKEHVATLHELLEEAGTLKPLDAHIGHASKFVERIQELLVYVSASCPFTESRNEKWVAATCHKKNNKPYTDASRSNQIVVNNTKKHAVKQNTQKTDNSMLPSTGRVSSTDASGSKFRSNTKKDRIQRPSHRSKKNKVEVQHRKSVSSSNKNNLVTDCNVNIKNVALSKNSANVYLSCNECFFQIMMLVLLNISKMCKNVKRPNPLNKKKRNDGNQLVGNRLHTIRIPDIASNAETRIRYSINSYGYPFNPPNFAFVINFTILAQSSWNLRFIGLLRNRKPELKYLHVFGALCYPTNDFKDLRKHQPKADIGILIGYSPSKKAYRIYNKRTRLIMETMNVQFDELTQMASKQHGFDEYFKPPSVVSTIISAATLPPPDTSRTSSSTSIVMEPRM
ncbi:retrovirus-related pol polyprotein from transposon TNT 1-94 [Tanacetum coccineum]